MTILKRIFCNCSQVFLFYLWTFMIQALCTQCSMDEASDLCCRLMLQPHWRLSWQCKAPPALIPTANCSGNTIRTPNIPQDDSQAHPWGLIRQLLHSLCLANTFFLVEILPNRLKGDFPPFFFSLYNPQQKLKCDSRNSQSWPETPPKSSFSSPAASPAPSLQHGELGIRARALLWEAQPEGRNERKSLLSLIPELIHWIPIPGEVWKRGRRWEDRSGPFHTFWSCREELVRDKNIHRKPSA